MEIGIISESNDDVNEGHFLNHFGVVKEERVTTKLRIVFDASLSDENGKSLNHFLYKGSNDWDLLKRLFEFRMGENAVTGNIEKAFLMVAVDKKDREFLRFL